MLSIQKCQGHLAQKTAVAFFGDRFDVLMMIESCEKSLLWLQCSGHGMPDGLLLLPRLGYVSMLAAS
jgi:hypothetical protein